MHQPDHAIVVAVSADGSQAAIRYAIDEATRSGSPLHLVHVLEMHAGEPYAAVYADAMDSAHVLLEAAQLRAKEMSGGAVSVTTELVDHGWVVGDLVARSETARLVVLEHRDLGRLSRLMTGSITNGVAARAHAPVVAVQAAWAPATPLHGVVTAAVQDPDEAELILRAAFEQARLRGADVLVLHAWWLANGYDDVTVDETMRTEWARRSTDALEPALAPLRERFPTVDVTVAIRHYPAAQAVLEASDRSDLVVVGRRHHRLPLFTHLGPVARALLGRSGAPVLLTPEPDAVPAVGP